MRSILIGSAAAILAISTASPAFAQYGGSPDDQVEQASTTRDQDAERSRPTMISDAADAIGRGRRHVARSRGSGRLRGRGPPPEDADRDDADQDVGSWMSIRTSIRTPIRTAADPGQTWQGEDGRSYCRRCDGTTGLIVGGGAGALVGRGIDSRGRRGTGTIIGAIAGAVVGSAIERSANEQRCR